MSSTTPHPQDEEACVRAASNLQMSSSAPCRLPAMLNPNIALSFCCRPAAAGDDRSRPLSDAEAADPGRRNGAPERCASATCARQPDGAGNDHHCCQPRRSGAGTGGSSSSTVADNHPAPSTATVRHATPAPSPHAIAHSKPPLKPAYCRDPKEKSGLATRKKDRARCIGRPRRRPTTKPRKIAVDRQPAGGVCGVLRNNLRTRPMAGNRSSDSSGSRLEQGADAAVGEHFEQ